MGRFRALAITTLLLGGTAMLPSAADAAIILSRAGVAYTGTGGIGNGSTVLVGGSLSPWAPNDTLETGAKWVSYNASTNPGGPVDAPNGAEMSITESFNLASASDLRIKVLADDTAKIILNGVTVWDFDTTSGNGPCQLGIIGCLATYAFDSAATATAAVLAAANVGSNSLEIVTRQTGGDAFGTQYAIYTPIPGAALLFGSALAGLAWVRRRGQKAEAPLAA